ncbi:MAG: molybdopterin-synthase adenylyltransferase MoeB [Paracoccaceae bacterium]|nr:molybdopterin-synthase adenylyltransferase MoeB [Paracoccaceae bacterium]
MLLVVILAAAVWGLGGFMGVPRATRATAIGVFYVGVLIIQFTLPAGTPLRLATGESPAPWLLLGGFAALIFSYRRGLLALRRRAARKEEAETQETPRSGFSDAELNRYARHIVLREIGGPGQKKLKEARVLIIGAGGLGAPALQYLAAAGVGQIGVIDDDVVENANLARQVIHKDQAIGMPKVFSAQSEMLAQNPYVDVRPYHRRLSEDIADDLFSEYDLVLDGTDNFETRYLVNKVATAQSMPLISGALSQWEGQLSVFDPESGAPCYRCIFPQAPAPELAPSCAEAGVLSPLPGVIGAMMAAEAIKIITGAGQVLRGQMVIYDALYGESRTISIARRPDCATCGQARAEAS